MCGIFHMLHDTHHNGRNYMIHRVFRDVCGTAKPLQSTTSNGIYIPAKGGTRAAQARLRNTWPKSTWLTSTWPVNMYVHERSYQDQHRRQTGRLAAGHLELHASTQHPTNTRAIFFVQSSVQRARSHTRCLGRAC